MKSKPTRQTARKRTSTGKLGQLKEAYCKAALALSRYQESHGLMPGAKVTARFGNDPEKKGTIPPYGRAWYDRLHFHVPVLLDNGRLQPWDMGDLTVESNEQI